MILQTKPPPWPRAALCMPRQEDLTLLTDLLTGYGWNVTCFSREEDFAQDHYRQAFDAVFVFLPGAAGQELAVRARQAAPGCVLVWGSDDPDFARSAFRLRATDFFLYPCAQERLHEALQTSKEKTLQKNHLGGNKT